LPSFKTRKLKLLAFSHLCPPLSYLVFVWKRNFIPKMYCDLFKVPKDEHQGVKILYGSSQAAIGKIFFTQKSKGKK